MFPPLMEPLPPRESEYLTENGRRIRDEIMEMIPMLRANAAEGERLSELPPETLKAVSDAGIFRMTLPAEYGGTALGARDQAEIIAALGRGDAAAGWLAIVAGATRNSLAFPEQTVQEVFKDAATWTGSLVVGASVLSPKVGDARKVDGGWMIKGTWHYGSGSTHAAWFTLGLRCVDETGRSYRALGLLPQSEVKVLDDWKVMGMAATASNSVTTIEEEAFVPDHRVFEMAAMPPKIEALRGRYEGLGFKIGTFSLMLVTPITFAALGLGMAEACLESFTEQAKKRKPFNLPYDAIGDMPTAQVAAGKARAAINVARTTIHAYADEVDRRALAGLDHSPAEEPAAVMDLVFVINLLAEAIDLLQMTLGSSTISLSNPIQRFARDIRVLATHGALRLDPMAEINGREILGLPPFPMAGFDVQATPPPGMAPPPGFAPPPGMAPPPRSFQPPPGARST